MTIRTYENPPSSIRKGGTWTLWETPIYSPGLGSWYELQEQKKQTSQSQVAGPSTAHVVERTRPSLQVKDLILLEMIIQNPY